MARITRSLLLALLGLFLFCSCSKAPPLPLLMPAAASCDRPLLMPCPQPIALMPPDEKPPFRKKLVVIDAGHGGDDLGTQSTSKPRYKEKHLNLATAKMLEGFLRQMGYKTIMTRTEDVFITLEKRAEIANGLKPDLFISIHYNSAPTKQAEGVEVFFYRDDKDKVRVTSSKQLAQLVLNKIVENTNAKSRGVKHGDLSVIRNTQMPAILVEGGFLTNDDEMQRLKDPAYLKRVAWGIAQGIQNYLGKN